MRAMTAELQAQLGNLPTDPGIYKYFDADGELIYVGKAVNLHNRVRSYFQDKNLSPKTQVLVAQIVRLEIITVQSEVDALILEANLIKEHKPRYNIILKDDKSHLYIRITLHEDYPKVSTCRQTDMRLDPKASYFGPYPSGLTVKKTLRSLRRVFPYASCKRLLIEGKATPERPCLYANLHLCPAPCTGLQAKKDYRLNIFRLVRFLEGKRQSVIEELEKDMLAAAKRLEFERAQIIKRQLGGIAYMVQQTIGPDAYISNPELMAEKRETGLVELASVLADYFPQMLLDSADNPEPRTENPLHRVECFDISNISGEQAVGSMVVFEDGEAKKSDYRKFKIKI